MYNVNTNRMFILFKAMPGIHSKPIVDIDCHYGRKSSGNRVSYTKCRRCGKRVSMDDISWGTECCLECGRNNKTGTYWDAEEKRWKSSSKRM